MNLARRQRENGLKTHEVQCPACKGVVRFTIHAGDVRTVTAVGSGHIRIPIYPVIEPHICGPRGGGELIEVAA